MQLLNLTLEIIFLLLFLSSIRGLLDLLVDRLELRNAFGDFLEALIDFLLELSLRHRVSRRGAVGRVGSLSGNWRCVHGSGLGC